MAKFDWKKALGSSVLTGSPLWGHLDDQLFGGQVGDAIADLDPMKGEYEKRRKEQEEADKLIADAYSQYDGLELPPEFIEDQWMQDYTPEEAQLALMGDSAMNDISLDPRFADAQKAGLDSLDELINNGGLSAADLANLNRVQSQAATADRGRREAIQQNMQQRGMSGSGMELLTQLQSNQAATDRQNQAGLDIAGMAQDRVRQATMDRSNMASNMQANQFDRESRVASANDAIAKFNTANENQNNQWNTSSNNDAERWNITGRQGIASDNKQGQNNWNQTQFDNDMGLRSAKANAKLGMANHHQGKANQAQQNVGNFWGGLANLGAQGGMAYMTSDEDKKEDIEPISGAQIEEFLDALKPKKYKYKSETGLPQGERVGIVIQDIEPTEIGASMVETVGDTKVMDHNNILGVLLDSVAHLHKKKKDR